MLYLFHMIISWAIVLVYLEQKADRFWDEDTASVYFLLSVFAQQSVPAEDDWRAHIIWCWTFIVAY